MILCLQSFKFHTREEATKLSPGAMIRDRTQGPQMDCVCDAVWLPMFSRSWSLTVLVFWTAPIRRAFHGRSRSWQLKTSGISDSKMDASLLPRKFSSALGKKDPISTKSKEAFKKKKKNQKPSLVYVSSVTVRL